MGRARRAVEPSPAPPAIGSSLARRLDRTEAGRPSAGLAAPVSAQVSAATTVAGGDGGGVADDHQGVLPAARELNGGRAAFRGEETRRERVVTAIRKARVTGIRVAVPVEALEARLSGLPAGVSVEPGRSEVRFNGAKDAVGRLFALDER